MSEGSSGPGLSREQQRALSGVLDELIPPSGDGALPGAGEIGLVDHIAEMMQRTPDLGPAIERGLAAIDELSARRGPGGFAGLSKEDRLSVLNELATTEPGFLPGLLFHTYVGYYQNGRVVEALGLEPRPPHPKGYELEPFDPTLLDEVRRRLA